MSEPCSLALVRFGLGLTQGQLADRAEVARETISRLERGATPQLTTAQSIASALGLPVDAIFPKDDDEGAASQPPLVTTTGPHARHDQD